MLKETQFKRLVSKYNFGDLLTKVRYPESNKNISRLLLIEYDGSRESYATEASTNRKGNRVFTESQIEVLLDSYDEMVKSLDALVQADFKIVKLSIIMTTTNSGSSIVFLDPRGRQYRHEYINDRFLDILPEDFLDDLSKFPTRLG